MTKTRNDEECELVRVSLAEARDAQASWALRPMPARMDFLRKLRHLVAAHATELASTAAAVSGRPLAEKLAAEVLPLADACLWLERRMSRVLAPRRCGKEGRPLWMRGMSFEVQRLPFGVVLVIGPANYPLFLPAVQTLHALAAGNAVLLKPAPRTYPVASAFAELTLSAGLSRGLLAILPESVEAARSAVARGVDKVIFTGSSENGQDLHGQLAARIKSGFVLINDLVVPTADPRMPFGGVKASGFGVTRGDEGLLEMTFPDVVALRRGKWHPHFDELGADAAQLFSSYILAVHGKGRRRIGALRELVSIPLGNFRSRKATTCKK